MTSRSGEHQDAPGQIHRALKPATLCEDSQARPETVLENVAAGIFQMGSQLTPDAVATFAFIAQKNRAFELFVPLKSGDVSPSAILSRRHIQHMGKWSEADRRNRCRWSGRRRKKSGWRTGLLPARIVREAWA